MDVTMLEIGNSKERDWTSGSNCFAKLMSDMSLGARRSHQAQTWPFSGRIGACEGVRRRIPVCKLAGCRTFYTLSAAEQVMLWQQYKYCMHITYVVLWQC